MAEKTVTDLNKVRANKRQKIGWTIAEIKKRAEEERAAYSKAAESEPDSLASGGNMKKILEEADDETEE